MYIQHTPYWFDRVGISKIEKMYRAIYMGPWCIRDIKGNWSNFPVEVFYQKNPDKSKGHVNYIGIYESSSGWCICNAESAFSESMMGVLCPDGEVLVSRYRHNCLEKDGVMIDGGRDYIRTNANGEKVNVTVHNGEFEYEILS